MWYVHTLWYTVHALRSGNADEIIRFYNNEVRADPFFACLLFMNIFYKNSSIFNKRITRHWDVNEVNEFFKKPN